MQTPEARGTLQTQEESTIHMTFSSQVITRATETLPLLYPKLDRAVYPDTGKDVF